MKNSNLDGQKFDVIVCGAGSAGLAAACSAARAGARTLLLERYGFCGGIMTAAMIHTFDAVKSCRNPEVIVVRGFAKELIDEIGAMGGIVETDNPDEVVTVHPELHKIAADRLLRRCGVTVLFYALATDALVEGPAVTGVKAALRDGRAKFHAPTVIDATGDADIAYHANADYQLAPDLQAMTCHFRLGNVTGEKNWQQLENACRQAMQAAHAKGLIHLFGGPWLIRLGPGEISVNSTRVYGSPVDPAALTAAEMEGRESMLRIWNILKAGVPELAQSYILSGSTQLHIRESRKITGAYTLTEEDILRGATFDDGVAVGTWPVDIHPTNGFVGVHPHKENPPAPYEIPFRCLVPRDLEGLLVAGKPLSTTHRAHGSTRVPGTSLATGQAAGVAAAMSARCNLPARRIEPAQLRAALRAQGAIVSVQELPNV